MILTMRLSLAGRAPHGRAHLGVDLRRVVEILQGSNVWEQIADKSLSR